MISLPIKKCKYAKIKVALESYMAKNYNTFSITDELKRNLEDIQQSRDILTNLSQMVSLNATALQSNIPILGKYIAQIESLFSRMTFGKNDYSCQILFEWTDTCKNNKMQSYNVKFEYYNSLFLLGLFHYMLSYELSKNNSNDEMNQKEITKNCRYAIYIFERILNEARLYIAQKEMPADLNIDYINFLILLSKIGGQIGLLNAAKITGTAIETQPKLAVGICNMLKRAYDSCSSDIIKNVVENKQKYFLNYKYFYYKGIPYKIFKESNMKRFNDTGKGFGDALVYQKKYITQLIECEKQVKKLGDNPYLNPKEFSDLVSRETNEYEKMDSENKRIYHEPVRENITDFIEEKIKISGLKPPELENIEQSVPPDPEVLKMIETFKQRMMNEIISQHLNKCENLDKVTSFIISLNIYSDNQENNYAHQIDECLWGKILNIQNQGGMNLLNRKIDEIKKLSDQIETLSEKQLEFLRKEEMDDNIQREKFGNRWNRPPSSSLNISLKNNINNILQTVRQIKPFDEKERLETVSYTKYFDLLNLSRDVLNSKIPGNQPNKTKLTGLADNENKQIKKLIEELKDLGTKCDQIINNLFDDLNKDEQYYPLFIEVLNKKTTELMVFENQKHKYNSVFNELEQLSAKINENKRKINTLNNKVKTLNNIGGGMTNDNGQHVQFIKDLDDYCNLFNDKNMKLTTGYNYYKTIEQKLTGYIKEILMFLQKRVEEKNYMLKLFEGSVPGISNNTTNMITGSALNNSNFDTGSNINKSGFGNSNMFNSGMNSNFSKSNFTQGPKAPFSGSNINFNSGFK